MAESSIFWTAPGAGDGTSEYTMAQITDWLRDTFLSDLYANQGVLVGCLNELAVSDHGDGTVDVATGSAYVYGFPYRNTAVVNVAIPTPAASTRVDRIVLRASWAAQTVRVTRIAGTEGAGAPALTQTPNTTYDVLLADVSITTGGVITISDWRQHCHFATRVNTENLDDLAVTAAKLADGAVDATAKLGNDVVDDTKVGNRVPQFYRRQGGSATDWTGVGTTDYTPTTVRMQGGAISVSIANGQQQGSATVTFPVAFSNKPLVFVTPLQYASLEIDFYVNASATQVDIYAQRPGTIDGVTFTVYWLAVGPE